MVRDGTERNWRTVLALSALCANQHPSCVRTDTMTTIPPPMFCFPLSAEAALIPRTPLIAKAYHELLVANHERLARWEPWAVNPPVLEETRSFLRASAQKWLDGAELPVAIAIRENGHWRLAGSVSLRISPYSQSGEIGYWIDGGYEGRGLASKAVAAVLDQAFGPLGLDRVALHTDTANQRSRALARRLGFTEEGLLRQALAFPGERRDQAAYGLLADEWNKRST